MASYVYLASAVITLGLAVVVFVAMARGRNWFDYSPRISPPRPSGLSRLAGDVRTWILAFAALILATTMGVVTALEGGSTTIVLGTLGLLVVGFVAIGVYGLGRSRGHHHAYAVGEALVGLGALFLVVLAGYLMTSFGA